MGKMFKNMGKTWLKYTWCRKPKILPSVYISVKLDGLRFRPIGTYAKTPHKTLLSYTATALFNIMIFSGLKCFAIYKTSRLKEKVAAFNEMANKDKLYIHKQSYDIKNFYTAIQKTHMLHRLHFLKQNYIKHNHTNIITIPKYKDKKIQAHPGPDTTHNTINFNINTIIDIVCFALEHAYFVIGKHIIKQIEGLPMGDPISAPLALIYVAYDEHAFLLHKDILPPNIVLIVYRYADDIIRLLATKCLTTELIVFINNLLEKEIYEHDIDTKSLEIKPDLSNDNKFLDADLIIYNNTKNIKLCYHNKNNDILSTYHQYI